MKTAIAEYTSLTAILVLATGLAGGLAAGPALAQLSPVQAAAQEPDDDNTALMLADQTSKPVTVARDWRIFGELAAGSSAQRPTGLSQDNQRLSFDLQYDHSWNAAWRLQLADRLDISWPPDSNAQHSINTLKEAYLSWKPAEFSLLDGGRINIRNGVAYGYNPTDFFKANALRTIVSIDPASIKENRQGSLALRAQQFWESGSASLIWSPDLGRLPNASGWNPDVGATNPANRWLLSISQKLLDLSPQFLLYQDAGAAAGSGPQFGLNLSTLLNDSMVGFMEWSGGRNADQISQALASYTRTAVDPVWHNRVAAGLSYTTSNKLTMTAEYHYNGAAPGSREWNQLRSQPLPVYLAYRRLTQNLQDLNTRQELFLHTSWQDVLLPRLDLSAMHNYDLSDYSKRWWLEARYHVDRCEFALQWQRNSGAPLSNFGAVPVQYGWQASMRVYF